ncbi:TPA: hypothetical protein ACH3X1_009510 [Trebouxia sp. C0004]
MSDSDNGSAGSVAHAPKARKGQDGRVAKLRNRFEHPTSQALTVVPARRSARVASAGQLHQTGKRCRSSAQPSNSEAPAASSTADPSAEPPTGHWSRTKQILSSSDLTCLLQTQTELGATRSELLKAQTELTAACSDLVEFRLRGQEAWGTCHSIARETAVRDGLQQQVSAEGSSLEHLSQRIRANNIVLHGVPDIVAHSRPADLTRYVSNQLDTATPRRGSLKYRDQGVNRTCKRGEAIRVSAPTSPSGASPAPPGPPPRGPAPGCQGVRTSLPGHPSPGSTAGGGPALGQRAAMCGRCIHFCCYCCCQCGLCCCCHCHGWRWRHRDAGPFPGPGTGPSALAPSQ